jgi:hypothetical protein
MNFKLSFNIPHLPEPLSIRQKMLLTGSCFAENIGQRMLQNRFDACINPNGIVFNPVSICKALERCAAGNKFSAEELFEHNHLWHSREHHGSFSAPDAASTLDLINRRFEVARRYLHDAGWIILTFGSAHVYEASGKVVANCHKMPGSVFTKRLLAVDEVVEAFLSAHEVIKKLNPHARFLFTVSPVRYAKDGLTANNLSKGTLLLAIDRIRQVIKNAHYFPAYEIVTDELRDYRFYAKDMVHPGELAIDYVWERFMETCCDDETKTILNEVKAVNDAVNHRPLHQGTSAYEQFRERVEAMKTELESKYPFLHHGEGN